MSTSSESKSNAVHFEYLNMSSLVARMLPDLLQQVCNSVFKQLLAENHRLDQPAAAQSCTHHRSHLRHCAQASVCSSHPHGCASLSCSPSSSGSCDRIDRPASQDSQFTSRATSGKLCHQDHSRRSSQEHMHLPSGVHHEVRSGLRQGCLPRALSSSHRRVRWAMRRISPLNSERCRRRRQSPKQRKKPNKLRSSKSRAARAPQRCPFQYSNHQQCCHFRCSWYHSTCKCRSTSRM